MRKLKNDNNGDNEVVSVIALVAMTLLIAAVLFLAVLQLAAGFSKPGNFAYVSGTTESTKDGSRAVTIQCVQGASQTTLPCQGVTAKYIDAGGATVESAALDQIYFTNSNISYRDGGFDAVLNGGDQIIISPNIYTPGGKLILVYTQTGSIIMEVRV